LGERTSESSSTQEVFKGWLAMRRYWHLAILPILVLPMGAFFLLKAPPATFGTAHIWADQASLQQLSYVDQGVPPAQNMANYLTELLGLPSFDYGVAKRIPLYEQYLKRLPVPSGVTPNLRTLAAADLSTKATAIPAGSSLVTVTYENLNPTIAAEVVRSILKEAASETQQLNKQQISKDISRSSKQLKKAQTAYSTAVGGFGTYMTAHRIKSNQVAFRQLSDPRLAALYQAVQTAQANVTTAQQQLTSAQTQQASQGLVRVLDPPSAQVVLTSKKKRLTNLMIPLVLGFILSGAFIVAMTLRDRSLRSPDDVLDLLGLPVLAVIPYTRGLVGSGKARSSEAALAAREA
jgi:uncharacterized protein involved in exopolysaccharide biosynthesis